jgi:hypothetical protein
MGRATWRASAITLAATWYATLAAYNGGPGNTIIWNRLPVDDPDLLLEVIRAEETRKYIMQIYEFFNIYRLIYENAVFKYLISATKNAGAPASPKFIRSVPDLQHQAHRLFQIGARLCINLAASAPSVTR